MKHSPIYTKTGDKGTTSLLGGIRKSKNDPIFEALGDIDELNASIGVAAESIIYSAVIIDDLKQIQSRLLDMGTTIAGGSLFSNDNVVLLERNIDEYDSKIPSLKNFILPGGNLGAAQLHLCRTICRRAERHTFSLSDDKLEIVCVYLNRLSDFLFVLARFECYRGGHDEIIYKSIKE